jgi:hypothetical protein
MATQNVMKRYDTQDKYVGLFSRHEEIKRTSGRNCILHYWHNRMVWRWRVLLNHYLDSTTLDGTVLFGPSMVLKREVESIPIPYS